MSIVASPTRQTLEPRAVARIEIRCAGCGYGGVVAHLPDRCPMCGGATWRQLSQRSRRSDTVRGLV